MQFISLLVASLLSTNALPISEVRRLKFVEDDNDEGATVSGTPILGSDTRYFNGEATFYQPEADACGTSSTAHDFVAALNHPQFFLNNVESDSNPNCGKIAHVTRGDQTVSVKIVDECPECKEGDLDLSPAAFKAIAHPVEGRVPITWYWE